LLYILSLAWELVNSTGPLSAIANSGNRADTRETMKTEQKKARQLSIYLHSFSLFCFTGLTGIVSITSEL
jgi:hypothetical protein